MKVLIADDDRATRDAVKLALIGAGYELNEADNLDAAYAEIINNTPDLMLLDVHFKQNKTSHELMERLQKEQIELPILILSGAATAKEAADLIKLGAYDFIEKPPSSERLKVAILRAMEASKLKATLARITTQRNVSTQLLGSSESISRVKRQISQLADRDVKVLITGETGTGKEVVAHSIWAYSKRKAKPFIVVNAAAIPENLVESELFGHVRGAFTGANKSQIGKIELASGGTLFLDEIGELSPKAQSKLLRFLENGEVQRVGAGKAAKCDVRFIAATSRNLEQEIEGKRFREDLFFRINVGRIELSPLRERGQDISEIFSHFIAQLCSRYEEPIRTLTPGVFEVLRQHDWPGNIRELRNVAERCILTAEESITPETVKLILGKSSASSSNTDEFSPKTEEDVIPLKEYRLHQEKKYILAVLALTKGNVSKTAQLLKVDRSHFYQKASKLGIKL